MELRGKGSENQCDERAGRRGLERSQPDDLEEQEPKAAESPPGEPVGKVVRPPGDERPLAELLADPELRLAWSEASKRSALEGRLGGKSPRQDGSEQQEPKAAELPELEPVDKVVRPPGDERPLAELLADPELRLAWSEAAERDGKFKRDSPAEQRGEAEHVRRVMALLEKEGHAPQRHEGQVTRQQLIARVIRGYDPAQTGPDKQIDAVTGKKHWPPTAATKFETPTAMVRAYEAIRTSEQFDQQLKLAEANDDSRLRVQLSLEQALGANYRQMVSGVDRDASSTTGWRDHQIGEGSLVRAIFQRLNPDSPWRLVTIYPI